MKYLKSIFLLFFALISCCLYSQVNNGQLSRGTGLEPTPDSLRLQIPLANIPFCSDGTEMPNSYDLSDQMPPVGDQGLLGSCCAWATGYAVRSYLHARKEEFSFSPDENLYSQTFSPAFIYNQLNRGENKGVSFWDALDFLRDVGCVTMSDMPYNENDYLTKPSNDLIRKAGSFKIESWKQINKGPNLIDIIKLQIYSGYPVIVGVNIDVGFQDQGWAHYGKKSEYIWKSFDSSKRGYHAMVCVGYSDELQALKIMNSWSMRWGKEGFVWIPYSFVDECIWEIYVAKDDNKFVPPPPPPPIISDTLIVIKRDTIQIVKRDTVEKTKQDTVSIVKKDTITVVKTDTVVVIKKDEINPLQIIYIKGVSSYWNDDYSDAVTFLKEYVKNDSKYDSAYYYLAKSYFKMRDYINSIENFNKVITISSQFTPAYKYRGSSYFNLGNFDKAINDLNISCDKNLNDAESFFYRGLSYKKKNELIRALNDFTIAINSNKSNPNLFYQRGVINIELKNYSEAISDFTYAININPNVSMFYMKKGFANYKFGNYKEATKDYIEAIKINPENFDANKELGISFYKDKKYSEALIYLSKAANIDNTDGFVFFVLGYSFFNSQDFKNAVSCWDRAIKINPSYRNEVLKEYEDAKLR